MSKGLRGLAEGWSKPVRTGALAHRCGFYIEQHEPVYDDADIIVEWKCPERI